MKTMIVSRDSWINCFNFEYNLKSGRTGQEIKDSFAEKYGIEHWTKIDLDKFEITFTDEKKMSYWILRWS